MIYYVDSKGVVSPVVPFCKVSVGPVLSLVDGLLTLTLFDDAKTLRNKPSYQHMQIGST
jgi:hypothetical protein